MKTNISATLSGILADTRTEIARDKARQSASETKARMRDAIPVISFQSRYPPVTALIAELKEKSPSARP